MFAFGKTPLSPTTTLATTKTTNKKVHAEGEGGRTKKKEKKKIIFEHYYSLKFRGEWKGAQGANKSLVRCSAPFLYHFHYNE